MVKIILFNLISIFLIVVIKMFLKGKKIGIIFFIQNIILCLSINFGMKYDPDIFLTGFVLFFIIIH